MASAPGLTVQDAAMVFARFGIDIHGLDPQALRRCWLGLARRYHTLGGAVGDQASMAEINAAYDTLRQGWKPSPAWNTQGDPRREGVCVWAWAGHGGRGLPDDRIERNDDRDPNFVKRRLWELSNGSAEEWTIWPFDGRRFMPGLTVYGTRALFPEMARAAQYFGRTGFRSPLAVFVQRHGQQRGRLLLLLLQGRPIDALPFDHQGGPSPMLDPYFVEALPAKLARMAQR